MNGEVKEIDYKIAIDFLLPKHYSGRKPCVSIAFGWFFDNELKAVCTFGKPASPSLCVGVCGIEYKQNVYELNRLCKTNDLKFQISEFVSYCLRILKNKDWIIVSYSDTAMNHHGYIYQACNFLYTGATKSRTDKYTENGKHSRHYSNEYNGNKRLVRSSKHRYIYFCTKDKALKRKWLKCLNYKITEYPKGDNSNYKLGEYIKPKIVVKEDQ